MRALEDTARLRITPRHYAYLKISEGCDRLCTFCAIPGMRGKHVTMHTLRHTAAMNLLSAGVDVAVIALWLGHADTHSPDAYLHADMSIKQAALDRTRPPDVPPGNYQPAADILAWLTSL